MTVVKQVYSVYYSHTIHENDDELIGKFDSEEECQERIQELLDDSVYEYLEYNFEIYVSTKKS